MLHPEKLPRVSVSLEVWAGAQGTCSLTRGQRGPGHPPVAG